MASNLQVEIVTPLASAFSGEASEVIVPGWEGEFGVLPEHDIVLSVLRGGIVRITTAEGEVRFVVGRGFVEAGPDKVVVLTDSAERPEDVDKEAAAVELAAADDELKDIDGSEALWDLVEARRELAQARLDA